MKTAIFSVFLHSVSSVTLWFHSLRASAPGKWPIRLLLAFWCAGLFLYGLGAGPLYRTESLRAIIGAECLRGHWLFPMLYGEPFLTKPPGQYVAIGLCSLPFGEVTAATARVPSVIAATAAVLLVAGMFRRVLGGRAGWIAGFLLPASVLWLDKAPSAEIDMTLLGWVTAALVLFHRALERHAEGRPSLGLLILSLGCVALGTLTKWTAPAFYALTVVPLLLWRRQFAFLFGWRHLVAIGVALIVCASWAIAVANEVGGDALLDTIRKEAAYRFHPGPKAKGYPWGELATYPLLVLAAHLPMSFFALRTLRPGFFARWDDRGQLLLQFLHCWTWPSLLFWTLVPNHNVRYALPLSPGLMGLEIMGFLAWSRDRPGDARPRRFLIAFLACWLVVKIVFVEVVVPRRTANRDARAVAAQLREIVPPGETVHLLLLKDEGVMFYYGRPAKRCRDPRALPRPATVLLIEREWQAREAFGPVELVRELTDQQGDPLFVVRLP